MICYTLSDCVLKNLNTDANQKLIINDLLLVFPKSNSPHKLVIDKQQKIIDIYLSYDSYAIQFWLEQMGLEPSSWEPVEVPNIDKITSNEEIFKTVCAQTEDKMLIVYNHNGWTSGTYCYKKFILHNNALIRVLDRIEASQLLGLPEEAATEKITKYKNGEHSLTINNTTYKVIEGVLATNGSSINDIKIK